MNQTIMKLEFNESLSDNSVKMIQNILRDSLGFKTNLLECYEVKP